MRPGFQSGHTNRRKAKRHYSHSENNVADISHTEGSGTLLPKYVSTIFQEIQKQEVELPVILK